MIDYIDLGPVPANEQCAQVGSDGYHDRARAECNRYRTLLEATYAAAHNGRGCPARVVVKSNPHDFGSYLEVGVKFDDRDREQVEAAFWLEANAPTEWPDRNLCEQSGADPGFVPSAALQAAFHGASERCQ